MAVRKILDISTGHLDNAAKAWIDEHESHETTRCLPFSYGWLCYVPSEPDDDDENKPPPSLEAIYARARTLDCDWIMLDADAEDDEELPRFSDEEPGNWANPPVKMEA